MNDRPPHTNGETYFFRDRGQFDLLRLRLLPELIERHRGAKTLRLWSAGCASGEEAYSLAMLVDMLLPERDGWDILILGSDIDEAALAKARRGHYRQWSFRMAPPALQQRYFRHSGDEWTLDERIRRLVTFRAGDLIGEAFPTGELRDMDLILCRNVFIYFGADAVTVVADKLASSLSEGGYLMTGHTELIGHRMRNIQSKLFAEGVVYRRVVPAPYTPPTPTLPREGGGRQTYCFNGSAVAAPTLLREGGGRQTSTSQSFSTPHGLQPSPSGQAREGANIAPSPLAGEGRGGGALPASSAGDLLAAAREFADRGEYEQSEQACRQALAVVPLAPEPHFLLAQLAQLKGNFERAGELLEKTLYLDPRCVAAHLELAALCERAENLPRAQTLRRAALDIVRALPGDATIEPYETTAAEMAQWLAQ